ncbi:hypothetical protein TraAM80_04699 [Trypanosoma rangeli]|uniref:Chromo domain-containing protein n=1 Tax=Trypanosoma rangeli TaxID=5698 RepID=A0A422NID1_TRYRA|nr:uncharacterized protein TraAM80_04699 [Trypanosoma rangeli]RNF05225.1 hypothetical protein TraAM80_04699 [Trypanosoma rangeli]|eukprot:RNF05225.1 hypothetical protein TraAM80_04699 [Trypanosoma rangeli]
MSVVSTRTSVTQLGNGSYSETLIPSARPKRYHIPRLIPVLESGSDEAHDVSGVLPPFAPPLAAVPAASAASGVLDDVLVKGGHRGSVVKVPQRNGYAEFVVKWKGLSAEQVEHNLLPLRLHYGQQLLMLEERRRRRYILTEEFARRIEVGIDNRYSAPLRERLLSWDALDKLSRCLQAMRDRSPQSTRMTSLSTVHDQRGLYDDPLHTRSLPTTVAHSSSWAGDSAKVHHVLSRTFGAAVSAVPRTLEEPARNAGTTEQPVRPDHTLGSSDQLTMSTVLSVSEAVETTANGTPFKRESSRGSRLTTSRTGKTIGADDDDDSLISSIVSGDSSKNDNSKRVSLDESLCATLAVLSPRGVPPPCTPPRSVTSCRLDS